MLKGHLYSAPMCQINSWLPIYDITPDNCLFIQPNYFAKAIKNSSEVYNYREWNARSRSDAAKHVRSDTREQPKPQQELEQQDVRANARPAELSCFRLPSCTALCLTSADLLVIVSIFAQYTSMTWSRTTALAT